MDAGLSPARQARARLRHELRTLTYVTLDQANGGVVRNLSHEGIGVQAVGALRAQQPVRVRFELRNPRVRVEARGEVAWATFSGQCGIRLVDVSPRMMRQIDEWIFGDLLEGASLHAERAGSMFAGNMFAGKTIAGKTFAAAAGGWSGGGAAEQDDGLTGDALMSDGLMVSAAPVKIIELPLRPDPLLPDPSQSAHVPVISETAAQAPAELDWLSQPLSGRALNWTINTLVVVAAWLLFALVFLSVTRELPARPLAIAGLAAVLVAALYLGFFQWFGGASPGARLARLVGLDEDEDEEAAEDRFR